MEGYITDNFGKHWKKEHFFLVFRVELSEYGKWSRC